MFNWKLEISRWHAVMGDDTLVFRAWIGTFIVKTPFR